jgi:hypothetical protein
MSVAQESRVLTGPLLPHRLFIQPLTRCFASNKVFRRIPLIH